jgi:hypothetical protein
MVQAMIVHEYEGEHCKGKECGFPQAEAYNVVVSVDLGGGRRCCIHALTEAPLEEDSVGMELLRGAALLIGGREQLTAESAGSERDLVDGVRARRPTRFFGIHKHTEVSPGTGCVDPSHHSSCDTLFGAFVETGCTLINGSNPQKWSCVHSDVLGGP